MPTPSKKELKTNKIGKIVNKLTKDSQNGSSIVQDKAQELVTKWKKDLKNRLEQEKAYQVHKSSQESSAANNIIDQSVNQDSVVKVSEQKLNSIPNLNGDQSKAQHQSHTEEKLETVQTLSQQLQLLSSFDIKPSTSNHQKISQKNESEQEDKVRDRERDQVRRSRDRERYKDKNREGEKFKERDNERYKQRERERHRDKERERDRNRDRDRERARNTKDRNKDKDTVQLQIQTKEEYSNSSNHKSSIQNSQTDKLPKKSNLVKVKQKKNTRKIVRFEKEDIKLRQLRYFSISDSPNAPFLNEQEIIPLRELPNGASFKNINDMKRADMLREKKTMSGAASKKVMKANELSKISNINSGGLNVELSSKLVNWSTQQLYCKYSYIYNNHYEIDVELMEGYARSNGDESDEIKNQRSREKGFIKPKYNYTFKLFIYCSFFLSYNTKQLQTKSQQLK